MAAVYIKTMYSNRESIVWGPDSFDSPDDNYSSFISLYPKKKSSEFSSCSLTDDVMSQQ